MHVLSHGCVALLLGVSVGFVAAQDGTTQTPKVNPAAIESGRGAFVATNGQSITAIYFKPVRFGAPGSVTLVFDDKKRLQLEQARSGSGIRFTNNLAEWWEHQGEATYKVNGRETFRGKKALEER